MKRKPDPHLQKFRQLKRDPANAGKELHDLWIMAGLELPSTSVPWGDGKASPAPARIRNDPRSFDEC